jgi:hypothetical protein
MQYQLLTRPDSQPKAIKGQKLGIMTFVMHFAPARLSGWNVCAKATPGCSEACIFWQGRGIFIGTKEARLRRTRWFMTDRASFMAQLVIEIEKAIRYARKRGFIPAFRLNATSDIPWHRIPVTRDGQRYENIMRAFGDVQFYDYTKVAKRFYEALPANYHLTFSLAESNWTDALGVLAANGNVAAVFRTKEMVASLLSAGQWQGFAVTSGDDTDVRFLDPRGAWVLLYAKGTGKHDATGFVRDLPLAA